jgi:heme/copper-type cytochrome/quinol oxidase subunit 2
VGAKPRILRLSALIALPLSGLLCLYAILGVIQAASFSATPGYPAVAAQRSVNVWMTVAIVSLIVVIVTSVYLWRIRRGSLERGRPPQVE